VIKSARYFPDVPRAQGKRLTRSCLDETEICEASAAPLAEPNTGILFLQLHVVHIVKILKIEDHHDAVVVSVEDPGLEIIVRVEIAAPGLESRDRGKAAGPAGRRHVCASCAEGRPARIRVLTQLPGIDMPVRHPAVDCLADHAPAADVSGVREIQLHDSGVIAGGACPAAVDESLIPV